jgi:hypothetical protein
MEFVAQEEQGHMAVRANAKQDEVKDGEMHPSYIVQTL